MARIRPPGCSHLVAIVLLLGFGGACSRAPSAQKSLTVFVAASLNDVIGELAAAFQAETGITVALHAGASGALRKQIDSGAPADVFISADALQVDSLVEKGRVAQPARVLAQNRLVIATPASAENDSGLPHSLTEARYKKVAIAEPSAAPAGRYARQALERAGIWDQMQDKLIIADDVRAAAQYAELKTVDAAIVYKTDVQAGSKIRIAHTFPADAHDACLYVGAVMANRSQMPAAREFLNFVGDDAAWSVWNRHGFDRAPPGAERNP